MDLMGPEALLYPTGYTMDRPRTAMDLVEPAEGVHPGPGQLDRGRDDEHHEEHPRRAGARPAGRTPGRQGPTLERGSSELSGRGVDAAPAGASIGTRAGKECGPRPEVLGAGCRPGKGCSTSGVCQSRSSSRSSRCRALSVAGAATTTTTSGTPPTTVKADAADDRRPRAAHDGQARAAAAFTLPTDFGLQLWSARNRRRRTCCAAQLGRTPARREVVRRANMPTRSRSRQLKQLERVGASDGRTSSTRRARHLRVVAARGVHPRGQCRHRGRDLVADERAVRRRHREPDPHDHVVRRPTRRTRSRSISS